MSGIAQLAERYHTFVKNVKDQAKSLETMGYRAVRPTWVSDNAPFLAFIDGVKHGKHIRLKVEGDGLIEVVA